MQNNESALAQNNEKAKKFCIDWFELYFNLYSCCNYCYTKTLRGRATIEGLYGCCNDCYCTPSAKQWL